VNPRPQLATSLGLLDDMQGGAIFDRASRIQVFALPRTHTHAHAAVSKVLI